MKEMEEYYMARERFIHKRLAETKKHLFTARLCAEALLYAPIVKNNPEQVKSYQERCWRYSGWAYEELEVLMQMILDNDDAVKRGFIKHCEAKKRMKLKITNNSSYICFIIFILKSYDNSRT